MVHGLEQIRRMNEEVVFQNIEKESRCNREREVNRLARRKGDTKWHSFGNVTFKDAAIRMFDLIAPASGACEVVVRDDQDGVEFEFSVEQYQAYRVHGLRGGDL